MDLAYFSYLAQTIPPRELARALAVRARRAVQQRLKLAEPSFARAPARGRPYALVPGPFSDAMLHEAEAALRGEVLLFGQWKKLDFHRDPFAPDVRYEVRVPGPEVNLFQPGADAKVMWEMGRLPHLWRIAQAFAASGEAKWSRAWIEAVRDFRAKNPAGYGVQWACAMEVSLRALTVAMSFGLVRDESYVPELLDLLEEHCVFVAGHLEETGAVRTNHYAADLVGIVVCGALFPELRAWHDAFARKLWDEIARQCRPDGTHFESSTGYQRLCAEMFLAASLSAKAAGLPVPAKVDRAVLGLHRSLSEMLNPSGNIPQIGDLDSCRALPLWPRSALEGKFDEERRWLATQARADPARRGSVLLPDAGVAVLRSGEAWLCMSAGPNGQGGTGGHAHNDKNSVELSFGALDVIVDRGTYVYARDPEERNARRSTRAHSSVQVDGLEQNRIVKGRLFALPDTARARIVRMERRDGLEIAVGEHRGYEKAGIVHRRIAALKVDAAAFIDELRGHGEHRFDLRWFTPHTSVLQRAASAEERARLAELHELGLTFGYDAERCVEVAGGALFAFGATLPWKLRVEETDVSPGYAEKTRARCIALRLEGAAPARLFTAVLFLRRR